MIRVRVRVRVRMRVRVRVRVRVMVVSPHEVAAHPNPSHRPGRRSRVITRWKGVIFSGGELIDSGACLAHRARNHAVERAAGVMQRYVAAAAAATLAWLG